MNHIFFYFVPLFRIPRLFDNFENISSAQEHASKMCFGRCLLETIQTINSMLHVQLYMSMLLKEFYRPEEGLAVVEEDSVEESSLFLPLPRLVLLLPLDLLLS